MAISASEVIKKLARPGPLAPLYVVYGDEPLLVLEVEDAVRAAARAAGFDERERFVVEGTFNWSPVLSSTQTLSLFSSQKLLEIAVPSGKPGKEGSEALMTLVRTPVPDTVILISLPRIDATAQKSKWFQALETTGVMVQASPIERAGLPAFLTERLARQAQHADADTLAFLADRVEGNLLAARQEIDKLALLLPPGNLALAEVENAVMNVARFDVFKLGQSLLAGDATRFIRMLDGLASEGEAPVLVLWALAEEVHALYHVQAGLAQGRPLQQLCRDHRIWGERQRLIGAAAQRVDRRTVVAVLRQLSTLDRLSKGLGNQNIWTEMRSVGLQLCGAWALGE